MTVADITILLLKVTELELARIAVILEFAIIFELRGTKDERANNAVALRLLMSEAMVGLE